jgi:hypothetical protein
MERALRYLFLSCAGSAGAAYYAHWQQRTEKARRHEGVVRDILVKGYSNLAHTHNLKGGPESFRTAVVAAQQVRGVGRPFWGGGGGWQGHWPPPPSAPTTLRHHRLPRAPRAPPAPPPLTASAPRARSC